jgi:hypothetical protein
MATKLQDKVGPASLHDQDFYDWAKNQAAALRKLQAQRPSLPLDFEHLIEEVEDLGENRLRAARSQLVRLVQHLLKLEYSPADRPRRQWLNSVDDARRALRDAMTGTIQNAIEPGLAELYEDARLAAGRDLMDHDETGAAAALPEDCPYPLDQLLTRRWYPANRHGLVDDPVVRNARP